MSSPDVTAAQPAFVLPGLPTTVDTDAVITQMRRRASSPGFESWWRRVESVGYCAHPIQLVGADTTGHRHAVWTRCNNRRATVCPSCADLYARDTWQLVHAGAVGGHHDVPAQVATHPQVFATLTAPGYGAVHNATGTTCHPKPAGRGSRCRHGKLLHCTVIHATDDPVVGQPLCTDCYDYLGHVLFAWHLPELWRRFTIALRRIVATHLKANGLPTNSVRVSFVKVVELQARAIPHIHALIRLDPPSDADTPASRDHTDYGPAAACGGGEPRHHTRPQPGWSSPITVTELAVLIHQAAGRVRIDVPTGDSDSGSAAVHTLRFGTQIDTQPLTPETITTATGSATDAPAIATAGSARLSPRLVAAYLAKYVTKSLHDFGITARRLSAEAITGLDVSEHVRAILASIAELAEHGGDTIAGIGRWLHTLGYRGHITTKSRHYSTTMSALRTARATWTRQQATKTAAQPNTTSPGGTVTDTGTGTGTSPRPDPPIDPDAVAWEFDHAGHGSAGDRVLVVSAALRHIAARITAITETRTGNRWPTPPGDGDG